MQSGKIIEPKEVRNFVYDLMGSEMKMPDLKKSIHTELAKKIRQNKCHENKDDGYLSLSVATLKLKKLGSSEIETNVAGLIDPHNGDNLVDIDTLYNVGSISKFILMVMTVRLIQSGHLYFSDVVSKYLKNMGLPNTTHITIEHLLGHRSGLKDSEFIVLKESDPVFNLLKMKSDSSPDLAGNPGDKFYYANINYVILAKIIQAVTGKNLQDSFEQLIGDLLNLNQIFVIGQYDNAMKTAKGYKPNQQSTEIIDATEHHIYGATSFRATPGNLVVLMQAFFQDDYFINPDLRAQILNSVKDETFEVVTKKGTYRWPTRMGLGIEESEVKMTNGDVKKIYCHGGWLDSHAAFLAYSPVDNAAYCACVSKTQGLGRLYNRQKHWNSKPLLFVGSALFVAGAALWYAKKNTTSPVVKPKI